MEEKSSGRKVAVKVIKRPIPNVTVSRIETEIAMQTRLGAQCTAVVEAFDAVLTDRHLAIAMEVASGGSLTEYVTARFGKAGRPGSGTVLSEAEACYFYRQFINAVAFCHANHIAHRDLKLDNTLLTSDSPPQLKLCDFGFAKGWGGMDASMMTVLGTPEYMAPEQAMMETQVNGHYNACHSDIWSSGVVLFVMLLGFFPFEVDQDDDNPGFERQLRQVWAQQQDDAWWKTRHVAPGWAHLSADCQDLLKRIFEYDEERRITVAEIQEHPWYRQKLPSKLEAGLTAVSAKQAQLDAQTRRNYDPLKMHQRARRLGSIVAAAAHPAGSPEAAEVLGSRPALEGDLETWGSPHEVDAQPLIARVSLVRGSFSRDDVDRKSGRASVDIMGASAGELVIPENSEEGSSRHRPAAEDNRV